MKTTTPRLLVECALTALMSGGMVLICLSLLHKALRLQALESFDLGAQAIVHGWTSPALTMLMRTFTTIGSTRFFIPTLLVAVLVLLRVGEKEQGQRLVRKRQVSAIFALGVAGALVLNDTLKVYFHRARPKVPWAIGDERTFSFPSGHSLFCMVLYGLIAYTLVSRRGKSLQRSLTLLCAAAMVLGIGVSRIYLGMHWPTDVLAGYLTGAIWLSGVILIDRRWRTHWRRVRCSD